MTNGKRLLKIVLTFFIILVLGYFLFTATHVELPELPEAEEAAEEVAI